MLKAVLLAIAIAAMPCLSAAADPTAKVEQGLLQGTVEEGLTVYRGIPFGAPPTGELRWRSPRPAIPWEGVRRADTFAPECVQRSGAGESPSMSEDCLYLNVWTPAKSASDGCPFWFGSTEAGLTPAPTPFPSIAENSGT